MDPAVIAAIAGLGSAVIVLVVALFVSRRATLRRVGAVSDRLAGPSSPPRRLETAFDRLEQAAGTAMERAHDATAGADRLRQALESVQHGVVVCDEEGTVVFSNGQAAGFLDARYNDVLAAQALREVLEQALTGGASVRQLELYGPPRRTLVLSGVPLDDGLSSGAAALVEDVSERRRVEAMRRDFVANISHELKTPVGALGLLAETLAGEDDPGVINRLAERMQGEAFRVGRVIDDLLDLSRIEAEEAPVREPVPVHLVVAQAVERVRPAAELSQVRVQVGEPSHRLSILGDRRQLVSALFNLLENAVKYSEPGSLVEVQAHTDGACVDLSVRDHGIGIPARDLERIFERFYRVDRGRGRDTGGTGLGLAIVRHVANNHRGEVRVESAEGEGSTFVLRLPAGPGPVAVSSEAG